jgi:hypothetical protein
MTAPITPHKAAEIIALARVAIADGLNPKALAADSARSWERLNAVVYELAGTVPPNFPKRCSCCGHIYSESDWSGLEFVGNQASEDETGRYRCELRNCSHCRTTLGIEFETGEGEKFAAVVAANAEKDAKVKAALEGTKGDYQ